MQSARARNIASKVVMYVVLLIMGRVTTLYCCTKTPY